MFKKHICITGKDGTGKSTIIKKLAQHYKSTYVATIWNLLENPVNGIPFNSKQDVDNFLCGLTPDSRLLFLAHAMKYSIDKAFESKKEVIITDGYYYKYFASEKVLGASQKLMDSLMECFPVPDVIIEIDLPLEIAANRKLQFSRYECGLKLSASLENFMAFQTNVYKAWDMFGYLKMKIVKSRENEEDTYKDVLKVIENEG